MAHMTTTHHEVNPSISIVSQGNAAHASLQTILMGDIFSMLILSPHIILFCVVEKSSQHIWQAISLLNLSKYFF